MKRTLFVLGFILMLVYLFVTGILWSASTPTFILPELPDEFQIQQRGIEQDDYGHFMIEKYIVNVGTTQVMIYLNCITLSSEVEINSCAKKEE